MIQADVNQSLQKRPCGENDGLGQELLVNLGLYPVNFAVLNQQPFHHGLADVQIGLGFHDLLHPLAVKVHVVLRP